ncbi:MAG: VWA domain-containing protein, partial [Candidatus Omnitrophica bacterium]|nr:VWA domain-containing protein [Candidatus Omnitrophota bacterium]
MQFGNDHLFWLYWIPILVIVFYWFTIISRRRALAKVLRREFVKALVPKFSFGKLKVKAFLTVLAVFFFVMALTRPQWGYRWEEVKRKGLDILIALDTSNSMLAEDVKPNRLERSKLAIKDLVRNLSGGDRVGLIAFAGTAFLQCPLTVDYNGFILSLNDISAGTIPRGGTAITIAIECAMRSYGGGLKKNKILIMITDGEDHEGDPAKAAQRAAR